MTEGSGKSPDHTDPAAGGVVLGPEGADRLGSGTGAAVGGGLLGGAGLGGAAVGEPPASGVEAGAAVVPDAPAAGPGAVVGTAGAEAWMDADSEGPAADDC